MQSARMFYVDSKTKAFQVMIPASNTTEWEGKREKQLTMCAENIAIAIFLRCSAGIFTKAVGRDQFQFLLRKLIDFHASLT
jgi:hypothetical protein